MELHRPSVRSVLLLDRSTQHSLIERAKTRHDQPKVIFNTRGSQAIALQAAENSATLDRAVAALEEDMYAATCRKPRDSRLQTWTRFHGNVMGESPVAPVSTEALLRISALFKAGLYKSFPGYLARAKELHMSEGYTWTQQLDRLAKCCSRSVLRGLSGDADRSEPIDYDKAMSVCMRVGYNTRFRKAAFCPFAIVSVGTLFLCREIELAGAYKLLS